MIDYKQTQNFIVKWCSVAVLWKIRYQDFFHFSWEGGGGDCKLYFVLICIYINFKVILHSHDRNQLVLVFVINFSLYLLYVHVYVRDWQSGRKKFLEFLLMNMSCSHMIDIFVYIVVFCVQYLRVSSEEEATRYIFNCENEITWHWLSDRWSVICEAYYIDYIYFQLLFSLII